MDKEKKPQNMINSIFSLSKDIRYVALYSNEKLTSSVKSDLEDTSASESDKYEELIVNPAILTLARQRGNIDCGGCKFVLIRYGNFYQYVRSLNNGLISICIQPYADPLELNTRIEEVLRKYDCL